MQRIGRKIILLLCSLTLWTLSSYLLAAAQEERVAVTFHYYRSNSDFENWTLWVWKNGEEGISCDFTEEGQMATVQMTFEATDEVGILVRYGEWEKKDVDEDRYIDLSQARNGMLDVYLLEGDSQIYYSEKDLPAGDRFLSADLDDTNIVTFCYLDDSGSLTDYGEAIWIADADGVRVDAEITLDRTVGQKLYGTVRLGKDIGVEEDYYIYSAFSGERLIEYGKIFDTKWFEENYTYTGDDLGVVYQEQKTGFRLWAPTARSAEVNLYETGDGQDHIASYEMEKSEKGTYYIEIPEDLNGIYYTYTVFFTEYEEEVTDPYAKTTGINGKRGMIFDSSATDPEDFAGEEFVRTDREDAVIYEINVRDFTMDGSSGSSNPGTYTGLAEEGTRNQYGESTGLDYLGELGVSYVQIMPCQDSDEVDEEKMNSYNWGYMTSNFFVPEGQYSTDPAHGEVRIREFKSMVQKLHEKGIGVIMDVVYNHTSGSMNFEKIVPGYYYRENEDGSYSNGSGCGNEFATERSMAGKFILDVCSYWVEEYHIDGFRFDLMGLIDLETMQHLEEELLKIDDGLILYGEGWNAGDSVYTGEVAESTSLCELEMTGGFNNVFRRGIQNYICSEFGDDFFQSNSVRFGLVGALEYSLTKETMGSWTHSAFQSVNYTTCHDGYTLWDLLRTNRGNEPEEKLLARNRLGIAVVMLSEGTPFWQSGEEFLRTKQKEEEPGRFYSDSYDAGDEVNAIKWDDMHENAELISYYRGLIQFRSAHSGFHYQTAEELEQNLVFVDSDKEELIAYTVKEDENLLFYNELYVIFNPYEEAAELPLDGDRWDIYINSVQAGTEGLEAVQGSRILVEALSATVLMRACVRWERIAILLAVGVALAAVLIFYIRKRNQR